MRIALLTPPFAANDQPGALSQVTAEVVARLVATGAEVDVIGPEDVPLDLAGLRPRHDLYVLKSQTPLALSWATALTAVGATVVNTARATALAQDKIATTIMLAGAGVPVPPTWTTGRTSELSPLLERGVLWIKPRGGRAGVGVHRVSSLAEIDIAENPADAFGLPVPLFAQREAPSSGHDLKVYVVGRSVWAISRPFPARTMLDKLGTPAWLPSDVRAAVRRCGEVLGLEIYGVDVLVSGDRFVVVDVNAFPGYKGVAGAPAVLADYLLHRAARQRASIAVTGVES
jgi:ribosomal protein S6--L-glutamate ligase